MPTPAHPMFKYVHDMLLALVVGAVIWLFNSVREHELALAKEHIRMEGLTKAVAEAEVRLKFIENNRYTKLDAEKDFKIINLQLEQINEKLKN